MPSSVGRVMSVVPFLVGKRLSCCLGSIRRDQPVSTPTLDYDREASCALGDGRWVSRLRRRPCRVVYTVSIKKRLCKLNSLAPEERLLLTVLTVLDQFDLPTTVRSVSALYVASVRGVFGGRLNLMSERMRSGPLVRCLSLRISVWCRHVCRRATRNLATTMTLLAPLIIEEYAAIRPTGPAP